MIEQSTLDIMEKEDEEQQNEENGNQEQQKDVECCENEDDLLFDGCITGRQNWMQIAKDNLRM